MGVVDDHHRVQPLARRGHLNYILLKHGCVRRPPSCAMWAIPLRSSEDLRDPCSQLGAAPRNPVRPNDRSSAWAATIDRSLAEPMQLKCHSFALGHTIEAPRRAPGALPPFSSRRSAAPLVRREPHAFAMLAARRENWSQFAGMTRFGIGSFVPEVFP